MANQFEALSVGATAVGITSTLIDAHENYASITCEVAPVRFRVDGTDPTSTTGHLLNVGDHLELFGPEVLKFKAISQSGATATLMVTVERKEII